MTQHDVEQSEEGRGNVRSTEKIDDSTVIQGIVKSLLRLVDS